jgi:tetratricopeptide (TPR) repeat protein
MDSEHNRTNHQPILVNGKPFFGRVEEQKRFHAALKEAINPPRGEDLPYVFLVYGDGGIGKSTLSRRFCDMAAQESNLWHPIKTLWIDWEEERRRLPALQVERTAIAPETVFEVIVTVGQRNNWDFPTYGKTRQQCNEAEQAAAKVLETATERPELKELRGAGAAALAKLLRLGLPIGESGERLVKAFLELGIQVGAERAAGLRQGLETLLRARLRADDYDLFVNPLERLARALADDLRRLAGRGALLVVLDTYEVVDVVDPWLRLVMKRSGPRLIWVLSGRNDLVNSRGYGAGYFKGYAEEWPRRLDAINVTQLARQDVAAYFAATVPERPLDDASLDAIRRATRGIPLAIALAAEMWQKGVSLDAIVADSDEGTPAKAIVAQMTARYLLHAVTSADRDALYALALARGDHELLRVMLTPFDALTFDVDAELRRLERAYASVYAGEARLHDDPQLFFETHLREAAQRQQVRGLVERGVDVLERRLATIAEKYDLIEERLTDEDYLKATLRLSDYLFWLDEERAWRWLVPRFVEALAYSRDLRQGLLAVVERWHNGLSAYGKRLSHALRAAETDGRDDATGWLDELERLAGRGYLAGEGEAERRAILHWQRGRLYDRQQRYAEALTAYDTAEHGLPATGDVLRRHLAGALYDLAGRLMWPQNRRDAVHHPDAVRILRRVTVWQPEKAGAWYYLGVALSKSGEPEQAIAAYQRAIALDPQYASPWNGLGNVYADLRRYDEAIAAYQRAIALDPQLAAPWHGLGVVYTDLRRYDEAIAAYQRAIDIDPRYAYPWNGLGNVYRRQGRYDEAIAAYQRAIDIDPQYASPWNGLGLVYTLQGELEQAVAAFRRAIELEPEEGTYYGSLAGVLRRLGREEEARQAIEAARPLMAQENEYNRACFAAICGDGEEALRLLAIALQQQQVSPDWARRDPDFVTLHADPRFWELVGGR